MKQSALIKCAAVVFLFFAAAGVGAQSLWDLANQNKAALRIATLFTAQDVRDRLSSDQGIDEAIDWCKKTGVTHAFIESFRDGYTAERKALEHARDRFRQGGFDVSGCVTPTKVGKDSTGWKSIACYTDEPTQKHVQEIFEHTASMFDEIMIDDFWFTDCQCAECQKARGDKSWVEYRCDLMTRVSRERILAPARAVNNKIKIIVKYPQWYEDFHNRGYEVVRETAQFDRIWVGTETRDPDNERWGKKAQYEAYFIMRWLGGIGGAKCGGGWFDPYGTHEDTYVEQARQTVMADAKEMLLFCYGSLLRDTGPANVERLRTEIPGLFQLARLVRNQPLKGIAAPKPPNSDAFDEQYVYDFVGMLGLPLVPTAEIRTDAKAAFLPVDAMKDSQVADKLKAMLAAKTPVLITDGLAKKLPASITGAENLLVLKVNGKPSSLLDLTREQLKPIRDKLLAPLGVRFDAPNKVALYLFGDHCVAIENFNDQAITAILEFSQAIQASKALVLPVNGAADFTCQSGKISFAKITPRTLVVLSGLNAVGTTRGEISRKEQPDNRPTGGSTREVDINSGDIRGSRGVFESSLSKEIRRLGISIPAERKWMFVSSGGGGGMYADGVYGFVTSVGDLLVRLLDETRTPDVERRVILEKFMTSLRTEGPGQAQTQGYLLALEIADKHGLHIFGPGVEKELREEQESRRSKGQ